MLIKKSFVVLILLVFFIGCKSLNRLTNQSRTVWVIGVSGSEPNATPPIDEAIIIINKRMRSFGADVDIKKISDNQIELTLYSVSEIEIINRIKQIIVAESRLEICKVDTPVFPSPFKVFPSRGAAEYSLGESPINRNRVVSYSQSRNGNSSEKNWVVVETPCIIDGRDLLSATATSRSGVDYEISFILTPEAGKKFSDWTSRNLGSYVALILNDNAQSIPYIRSQINEQGEISGRFTKEEAEDLALILNSGYFSGKLLFQEEKQY